MAFSRLTTAVRGRRRRANGPWRRCRREGLRTRRDARRWRRGSLRRALSPRWRAASRRGRSSTRLARSRIVLSRPATAPRGATSESARPMAASSPCNRSRSAGPAMEGAASALSTRAVRSRRAFSTPALDGTGARAAEFATEISRRISSSRPDRASMPVCSRSIRVSSRGDGAATGRSAAARSSLRLRASKRSSIRAASGAGPRAAEMPGFAPESRSRWRAAISEMAPSRARRGAAAAGKGAGRAFWRSMRSISASKRRSSRRNCSSRAAPGGVVSAFSIRATMSANRLSSWR